MRHNYARLIIRIIINLKEKSPFLGYTFIEKVEAGRVQAELRQRYGNQLIMMNYVMRPLNSISVVHSDASRSLLY